MHKKPILVCYDITDNKRLQKLQRYISQHLLQIQYSMYYGVLSPQEIQKITNKIQTIINQHHDDVRIYEVEPLEKSFLIGKRCAGVMLFGENGEQINW